MEKQNIQKTEENYFLWGLKTFAGVLVFGILGIHFVVNHLVAPEGLLTYTDILAYYQNAIVPIMEIAFLVFVVAHALLGLRSIILDMQVSKTFQKYLDFGLFAIGILSIGYGTWIVVQVVQLGNH